MSIIFDALKKVEPKVDQDIPQQVSLGKPRPKQVNFIYLIIVACGVLLTAIFYTIPAVFRRPAVKTLPPVSEQASLEPAATQPPAESVSNPAQANTGAKEAPVQAATEKPEMPVLVLNGVFFSGDEGYALINNRILREGDAIQGLVIQKIGANEVQLKNRDTIVNLTTN